MSCLAHVVSAREWCHRKSGHDPCHGPTLAKKIRKNECKANKFQCVGSTLTPKFWRRYDKYNDDSNSKASPYLINICYCNFESQHICLGECSKCCLAQLKCRPIPVFLSRTSKKILSTVHCPGQYFTFYTLPTDLHNNEQHSIYLHNIAHNLYTPRVLYIVYLLWSAADALCCTILCQSRLLHTGLKQNDITQNWSLISKNRFCYNVYILCLMFYIKLMIWNIKRNFLP